MFQLIAAIIAILLVLLLILAAIWYGGDVFSDGTAKANYARNVNSATQIEAAMQLYYQDHSRNPTSTDMALLNDLYNWGYLKELPKGDWKVNPIALYKPIEIQDVDQCAAMNKAAGFNLSLVPSQYEGCPPCNGAEGSTQLTDAQHFARWPGCQFISTTP